MGTLYQPQALLTHALSCGVQEGKPLVLSAVKKAEAAIAADPASNKVWRPTSHNTLCSLGHDWAGLHRTAHLCFLAGWFLCWHACTLGTMDMLCLTAGVPGHHGRPGVLPAGA